MLRRGASFLIVAACACGDSSSPSLHGMDVDAGGATGDGGAPSQPDAGSLPVPGTFPDVLGASYDSAGSAIRFRVYSEHATRIEVYVYAAARGEEERARYVLAKDPTTNVWSKAIDGTELARAGVGGVVYYGYRAWGPNWDYDPAWSKGSVAGFVSDVDASGNRFNPNKLLFDPYARELSHDPITPEQDGSAYNTGDAARAIDSGPKAPKGLVLKDEPKDLGAIPTRPFKDDAVYEVHVRGLTKSDPAVPAEWRGTYRGAALKASYLKDLGITTIELLPIHETQNDTNDVAAAASSTNGMNYWGYSTLSFFAPDRRHAFDKSPGGPTREFRAMVKAFHDAGIKVFMDVVYNHTGEGGVSKTTPSVTRILSWRGLDNAAYYELASDHQTSFDSTGTSGNFNTANTAARNMIIDSLRHWKDDMGVDGFRFDLAPVLGNTCANACFQYDKLDAANALNRARKELPARGPQGGGGVELIAEPWAIGTGTYQLGNFPSGWSEWNGNFRDVIRRAQNKLGASVEPPQQIAARLLGSSDLFADDGRKPSASVNYIASHDGFTLRDFYAYDTKSNAQAWPFGPSTGGDDNNDSWSQNGDPALQHQAARTGLSLLFLAAGVPMITGGDEMYRTQYGNNNPYNLDSEKNWLDWSNLASEAAFVSFARNLIRFRAAHAALRPASHLQGKDANGNGLKDVTMYRASGAEADAAYLGDGANHFVAYRLDGAELGDAADSLYVAYNAAAAATTVTLPKNLAGKAWYRAGDSGAGTFEDVGAEVLVTAAYPMTARSVLVLIER